MLPAGLRRARRLGRARRNTTAEPPGRAARDRRRGQLLFAALTADHAIALEGGGRGVTSNTIRPAYVRTPLVEDQIAVRARTHGISPAEVVETIMLAEPAIKRLIEPTRSPSWPNICAARPPSFVNGTSIVMDGGWTAR